MGDLQVLGSDLLATAKKDFSSVSGVITGAFANIQQKVSGTTAASVVVPAVLAQGASVASALIQTGEQALVDEGLTFLQWLASEAAKIGPSTPAVQK